MGILEGIKLSTSTSLAVSAAGACVVSGVMGGMLVKKALSLSASKDPLPEKWVKVGEIKEMVIYPVKSLPGISVNEAALAKLGLKGIDNPQLRDRVFVIVNQDGVAITQIQMPLMALIKTKLDGNKLHLSYVKDSSTEEITVDIPNSVPSTTVAIVMREKIPGVVDCGDAVANWLNKVTGKSGLRLLYHTKQETPRKSVKRNSRFHTYRESHIGAFQDETSYMLMTDESVAALNEQIGDKPVSHKNFRPTIVVSGVPEPFAEDFWGYIKIGQGKDAPIMKTSLPCQRCKLTTVDPETAEFRSDGEPLRSLYKLKRPVGDEKVTKLISKAAIMGSHFGVFEGEGSVVRVGDPVYAALL